MRALLDILLAVGVVAGSLVLAASLVIPIYHFIVWWLG